MTPMSARKIGKRLGRVGSALNIHITSHMFRTGLCVDTAVRARLAQQMPDWNLIADVGSWRTTMGRGGSMARDYYVPELFWGSIAHRVRVQTRSICCTVAFAIVVRMSFSAGCSSSE